MTSSERERRIEVVAQTIFGFASPTRWDTVATGVRVEYRKRAAEVLDAADEVVPMVSEEVRDLLARTGAEMERLGERTERAEAAARDMAQAIQRWLSETGPGMRVNTALGRGMARQALARWASFSGEEGTG